MSIYTHRPAVLHDDYALIPIGEKAKYGYAKVDLAFSYIDKYKWTIHKHGYAWGHIDNRACLMHRFILNPSDNLVTDHINGDRLDNRLNNIRVCTRHQNNMNIKPRKNRLKGVRKMGDRYFARVMYMKKEYALGGYETATEAAQAYDKKALELFAEFANLNFPNNRKGRVLSSV